MAAATGSTAYALASGATIGPYTVLSQLGKGGMGEVYLVSHKILTTRHALKLLPEERSRDSGFLYRFHSEARVMATLDHPGIVRVTGADEVNGRHYLIMDFIAADNGDTPLDLEEAMSSAPAGRVSPAVVARLVAQVCEAVYAAHARGVIHRDLKPANVLLTSRDLTLADTRVADFGLARLLGDDWLQSQVNVSLRQSMSIGDARTMARPRAERSSTGALLGTYEYMSPEQREGLQVDERSDIFAIGVMLYRMITGKPLIGRAKAASKVVGSLADGWDDVIDRCLDEDPAERYGDMAQLAQALYALEAVEERLQKEERHRQEQERREAAEVARRQQREAEQPIRPRGEPSVTTAFGRQHAKPKPSVEGAEAPEPRRSTKLKRLALWFLAIVSSLVLFWLGGLTWAILDGDYAVAFIPATVMGCLSVFVFVVIGTRRSSRHLARRARLWTLFSTSVLVAGCTLLVGWIKEGDAWQLVPTFPLGVASALVALLGLRLRREAAH